MADDVDIRIGGNTDDLKKVMSATLKAVSSFAKDMQATFQRVDVFKTASANAEKLTVQIKELEKEQKS